MGKDARLNPNTREFAATAPLTVLDMFGRTITEGTEIQFNTPHVTRAVVTRIAPVMRPDAPPGLVEVTCYVRFPLLVPRNQVIPEIALSRTHAELVAAGIVKAPVEEATPADDDATMKVIAES